MRLTREKRDELKALAEKARKSFKEGLSCVEFQTASRQALPDALSDIEELESKLADAVKALEKISGDVTSDGRSYGSTHCSVGACQGTARATLAKLRAK